MDPTKQKYEPFISPNNKKKKEPFTKFLCMDYPFYSIHVFAYYGTYGPNANSS